MDTNLPMDDTDAKLISNGLRPDTTDWGKLDRYIRSRRRDLQQVIDDPRFDPAEVSRAKLDEVEALADFLRHL